jgi:HEAT repeat protein
MTRAESPPRRARLVVSLLFPLFPLSAAAILLATSVAPREGGAAAGANEKPSKEDEAALLQRLAALRGKYEEEKERDPTERAETIKLLGGIPTKQTVQFLHQLYEAEKSDVVLMAVSSALGHLGTVEAARTLVSVGIPKVENALETPYWCAELGAALRGRWTPDAEEWLLTQALTPAVRKSARGYEVLLRAMAGLKSDKRVKALEKELLQASRPEVLVLLFETLREEESESAARAAVMHLKSANAEVQVAAYDFLAASRSKKHARVFADGLKSPNWEVRAISAEVMARSQAAGAVKLLGPVLADPDSRVQVAVVRALLERGGKDAFELLLGALGGARGRVQDDIADALARLTGKNLGAAAAQWESWWAVNKEGEREFVALPPEVLSRMKEEESDQSTVLYHGLRVLSERAAFLIDCSESMAEEYVPRAERENADEKGKGKTIVADPRTKGKGKGEAKRARRIEVVKREILGVIERLKDGVALNVIRFDSLVVDFIRTGLQGERALVKLDDAMRARLREFVARAQPGGQTNLSGVIREALEYEDVDTIYLLSDGAPTQGLGITDPEELLGEVRRWNRRRRVRINTIGFDLKPAERQLLLALADQNYGVFVER